jgi:hypothetical protein
VVLVFELEGKMTDSLSTVEDIAEVAVGVLGDVIDDGGGWNGNPCLVLVTESEGQRALAAARLDQADVGAQLVAVSDLFKSYPPVACGYAVHVVAPADAEHAEPYSQALIVALDGQGGTATLVCEVDVDEHDREMLLALENAVLQAPGGLLHECI